MRITKRVDFSWVKVDRYEPLDIVRTLSREQAWAFMLIEKLIYFTGDQLIDNDKQVAHEMRCDVRTYRRLKNELIAAGAMVIEEGKVTIPHASAAVTSAISAYRELSDIRSHIRGTFTEDRPGSHIKLVGKSTN